VIALEEDALEAGAGGGILLVDLDEGEIDVAPA